MFDEFSHTSKVISDFYLWIFLMMDDVCMDVNSITPHSNPHTPWQSTTNNFIEQQNFKVNQNG